jgi:hypothetical protein
MNSTGWRALIPQQIKAPEDAVMLVSALGFCTWGPVPGLAFPNLAEAMGETASSVLAPTWSWKDDLHFAHQLYYAKIINGQPSFIAPDALADCIAALAGRGSEEERNPLRLYLDGRLSREASAIYNYLLDHPVQPTRALRRGTRLADRRMKTATERALTELQRRFLVCKVDLTGRTRGTYSYIWDVAERFWPAAFEDAREISPHVARQHLRTRLRLFGLEPTAELEQKLFLWR